MCGIAGIIIFNGSPIADQTLDNAHKKLQHRGPDGQGRFRDSLRLPSDNTIDLALIHTRLAILDPEHGNQPMLSSPPPESENDPDLLAVVFNGCIYNHRELRTELQNLGHHFTSDHSDTEVILHGYRQWGPEELPKHLDGMFAYAVWDHKQRTLTISRDRSGEKPLYIKMMGNAQSRTFIFASTIPAAQALASSSTAPTNPQPQHELIPWHLLYLANGYCSPSAFPQPNMHLLQPGHTLIVDELEKEKLQPSAYWPSDNITLSNSEDPATLFDSLIRESVHDRLEADVPLGCFLSGGIDSSLIAKYATEKHPDLKTFCVRMPDTQYDESEYAQQVAKIIGSSHTTLDPDINPTEDLIHLIKQLGQPFADSSILPTYWVCKAARKFVKVALSGDGADELFFGYERFRAATWLRKYRALLVLIPDWPIAKSHPKSKLNKLARLARAARGSGYSDLTSLFSVKDLRRLDQRWRWSERYSAEPLEIVRFNEFTRYLPDDILRKVDTASLAVALEVRAPFLATKLIEHAFATPPDILIPGGKRKYLLKYIARKYFPDPLVDRPKMGFALPLGNWFRTDKHGLGTMLQDHLNSTEPFGDLPLNLKYVGKLLNDHMAGKQDHAQKLFALLTLSIWAH